MSLWSFLQQRERDRFAENLSYFVLELCQLNVIAYYQIHMVRTLMTVKGETE